MFKDFWQLATMEAENEGGAGGAGGGSSSNNGGAGGNDPAGGSGDGGDKGVKLDPKLAGIDKKEGEGGGEGDNKEGEQNEANELLGAIEGDDYTDVTLDEGMEIDPQVFTKAKEFAKELGLSQKGLQKLSDFYTKEVVIPAQQKWAQTLADWGNQTKADKEFGGDKYEANEAIAKVALDTFGTPEFKEFLTQYGLGNHPEMMRMMWKVGRAIVAEDSSGGDKGGGGGGSPDVLDLFYGPKA